MNATEINDHIKARPDGIAVSFGIECDCEDRAALLKEYAVKLRLAKEGE